MPTSYAGGANRAATLDEVDGKLAALIGCGVSITPGKGAALQRGSSRNVVGRTSARTIDCA